MSIKEATTRVTQKVGRIHELDLLRGFFSFLSEQSWLRALALRYISEPLESSGGSDMKAVEPSDQLFLLSERRQQPMHVGGLQLFIPPELILIPR